MWPASPSKPVRRWASSCWTTCWPTLPASRCSRPSPERDNINHEETVVTATIAWGGLGFARIARLNAIPAMQRAENAHFYGVASRDPNKLAECKNLFGVEHTYARYE